MIFYANNNEEVSSDCAPDKPVCIFDFAEEDCNFDQTPKSRAIATAVVLCAIKTGPQGIAMFPKLFPDTCRECAKRGVRVCSTGDDTLPRLDGPGNLYLGLLKREGNRGSVSRVFVLDRSHEGFPDNLDAMLVGIVKVIKSDLDVMKGLSGVVLWETDSDIPRSITLTVDA